MLRLYYLILRLMSPAALAGLYMLNKVTHSRRVRAVLIRDDGRVLLVVNALGDQRWSLPGGGVGKSETDEQAIVREVHEELRLKLVAANLECIGEVPASSYVAPIYLYLVDEVEVSAIRASRAEIREIKWSQTDKLPANTQEFVTQALALVGR